jgi:hypothetical protein
MTAIFTLPLRIVQGLFALVVLGLTSYGTSSHLHISPPKIRRGAFEHFHPAIPKPTTPANLPPYHSRELVVRPMAPIPAVGSERPDHHRRLDAPRAGLPRRRARALPRRRAQIRHPGRRGPDDAVLARGIHRPGRLPERPRLLRHRLQRRESRRRVCGFRVVRTAPSSGVLRGGQGGVWCREMAVLC